MVYAHLPPIYKYHATLYAIVIYNVTQVKELCNKEGNPATPYELFFEEKPRIAHLCVFGCPTVHKKWVITNNQVQKRGKKQVKEELEVLLLVSLPISKVT